MIYKNIGSKLTVITATLSLGLMALATLIITSSVRDTTEEQARKLGEETGRAVSKEILVDIENIFVTASFLAGTVDLLVERQDTNRDTLAHIIEASLAANQRLLGSWVGMFPNTFDGQDAASVGQNHSDPDSGQFSFYAFRNKEGTFTKRSMKIAAIKPNSTKAVDSWFTAPIQAEGPAYTEPVLYDDIGGRPALLVDVGVPIYQKDGRLLGVAGTDIEMLSVAKRLKDFTPLETGSVHLISSRGKWVGYSDTDQLGKPIEDSIPELADYKDKIQYGESFSIERHSTDLGEPVISLFVPVLLPGSTQYWSVMVNLPKAKMYAEATELTQHVIAIFIVLILAVSLSIWMASRHFVSKPILRLVASITQLSNKEYDCTINCIESRDETGVIAHALDKFRVQLQRVDALEAENNEKERRHAEDRKAHQQQLTQDFNNTVGTIVNDTSASAQDVDSKNSDNQSRNSGNFSRRSNTKCLNRCRSRRRTVKFH